MKNRETSWADAATIIFLDQPIDVGFSYVQGNLPNHLLNILEADFTAILIDLYNRYPEFRYRPLYFAGEDSASKMIGAFAA